MFLIGYKCILKDLKDQKRKKCQKDRNSNNRKNSQKRQRRVKIKPRNMVKRKQSIIIQILVITFIQEGKKDKN